MEADQETQEATAGSDEQQHDEGEEEEEQHLPPPAEAEAEAAAAAAAAAREGAEEGDEEEEDGEGASLRPSFPPGRVKRIVKLDREIGRVNSEALHLISLSADLFLGFLADKAGEVAFHNKKKSVRIEHLRAAAHNHQPTGDFLLDSLPQLLQARTIPPPAARRAPGADKPLPPGARRIDEFFHKSSPSAIE